MNILTFTYTKPDGKVSDRVLVVTQQPNDMYEGIDISELQDEAQADMINEMNQAYDTYLQSMANIKDKFDVVHSFRRFNPLKMTNIIKEKI
jgi:hypothetical protein